MYYQLTQQSLENLIKMKLLEYLKLNDVQDLCKNIVQHPTLKGFITIFLSIFTFGFDPLNNKAYLAIFILIISDCISAMLAAYKTGEQIRSAKFFRTPVKFMIYFGLIYLTHIAGFGLPIISTLLDDTMIGFLTATELISVMENVHKLGYEVPNQIVRKLINIKNK